MSNEPSMEEILSSIKRIIADEDRASGARPPRRAAAARAAEPPADDQILELTDALPAEPLPGEGDTAPTGIGATPPAPAPAAKSEAKAIRMESKPSESKAPKVQRNREAAPAPATAPAPSATLAAGVLSDVSAQAARESLDHLSRLLIRNDDGHSNTLEGMVRELVRPMLKDWLDARLPEIVETMVKREIDRITGRF